MSQTTIDQNATPEGAANGTQAPAKPAGRPRRRGGTKPAASAASVEQTQSPAQPATAEAPAPAQTAARPQAAPVSQETPADQTQAPAQPAGEAPAPRGRGHGRSRRGRESRKTGPQLVMPPTQAQPAEGEETPAEARAAEQLAAPAAPAGELPAPPAETPAPIELPAAEPRIVPVTTTPAEAQPAAAMQPTAAARSSAEAPAQAPAPVPTRRYRFERRTPGVQPLPAIRPERLSSAAAAAAPAAEARVPVEPAPAPEASAAAPEEPWRANVAEVEPADVARTAAEAPGAPAAEAPAEAGASTAVDDLIAALGLRDTAARAAASEAPLPAPSAETVAEAEAEAEAEHAAEGEAQTTGRRRRRRRRGGSHAIAAAEEAEEEHAAEAAGPRLAAAEEERDLGNGYEPYYPYAPAEQPYSPFTRAPRERERAPQAEPWEVAAQEGPRGPMSPISPFAAPEPSFARGFGPQPRGVAQPLREPYPRTPRIERGMDTPPMSSNQLAQVVSHAIQQQTDRLLNELRQQGHTPSMTVQFPALPSTERVGIFVDVANLLYSARTLRIHLDFGRLLDFLRGNRRLIRAHAYAPTNPDPNADQSFLNAVKGLGYRITTKNYKTFASGAKKADMDLDLCMDIVRMVDAKAIDTVVLVSGDSDFLPLLEYCSDHGVRVEVAAFDDSAAMILRQSCDVFINLSVVDEIRY